MRECLWRICKHNIVDKAQFDNIFLDLWKFTLKMRSSALSDCEVRAMIKFLNLEGVTGLEIHHRLSNVYGAGTVMSLRYVYKWIDQFNLWLYSIINIIWTAITDKKYTESNVARWRQHLSDIWAIGIKLSVIEDTYIWLYYIDKKSRIV